MTTLWVLSPVYFDVEPYLALRLRIVEEWGRFEFPAPDRLRFIVVDDSGGQDPDMASLRRLPDVVIVTTPFNLGHQRAIVFALRRLAPDIGADDWIVTLDADGEDQPSDVPRLLGPLAELGPGSNRFILAWRVKRRESLPFKVLYAAFKLLFRVATGTIVRTGNFAAFHGRLTKQILFHPYFDLSYSSTLIGLHVPATFVPCERGTRYAGHSKMRLSALIRHGLRMLMPFTEQIATRALISFGVLFGLTIASALAVGALGLFTTWTVPGWATYALVTLVAVSLLSLINSIALFVLFAQSEGMSLRGIHGSTFGATGVDTGDAPAGTGPSGPPVLLASSPVAPRGPGAPGGRSV